MNRPKEISLLLLTDPEFVKWVRNPKNDLELYWNNWLLVHPEHLSEVKKAREILLGLRQKPFKNSPEIKSRVLLNVLANEKTKSVQFLSHSIPGKEKKTWLTMDPWYKIAMILVLTGFMGYLLNQYVMPYESMEVLESKPTVFITKSTQFGEKLNFKLPDGTNVWLNSGSQLTFPDRFDSLERKVFLEGEGYFEVMEDSISVFKVMSGNLETEALGTSFNINFTNPQEVLISLITGKVKIHHVALEENYLLAPGDQLQYLKLSKGISISKINSENTIGWKSGVLCFKSSSFNEVINRLERWYGVEIKVTGVPSKKWLLSGKYKNQNLDLVLDRMSFIESFKYDINGKKIHLKF